MLAPHTDLLTLYSHSRHYLPLLLLLAGAAARDLPPEQINWDEVSSLVPEWDRVESGIDDLLSLSTTYWEPGLGPRAPRGSPDRGRSGLLDLQEEEEEEEESPSAHQLNKLMHQAMRAVNTILHNIEKEKG